MTNNNAPVILFLDFDGTLHPLWTSKAGPGTSLVRAYEGPWLTEAATLAELLAPHTTNLEVVISSLWARRLTLEELRALLPSDLRGLVRDAIWTPNDKSQPPVGKFAPIQAWLQRSGCQQEWIALDDDNRNWPEEQSHKLVWAKGTLASIDVQRHLTRRLDQVLQAPRVAFALNQKIVCKSNS